jgi:flagellar basal body rod protein FlgG
MRKLEVQNNNLANVNTVGFKRQYIIAGRENFDETLAKEVEPTDPFARGDQQRVSTVSEMTTQIDFSIGPIRSTGNPLDVALRNKNDFFVINTPQGPRYTRAGNFSLGAEGQLVTVDGAQVQGDGGTIVVNGTGVHIAADGSVRAAGQTVGRLQVVNFADTSGLEATDGARFKLRAGAAAPIPVEARLEPQSLEMSNASAITGMIDLITTNRAFDAYQKAAQTIDSLNQAAIQQVGKRNS